MASRSMQSRLEATGCEKTNWYSETGMLCRESFIRIFYNNN
jgi:hypothetical protein